MRLNKSIHWATVAIMAISGLCLVDKAPVKSEPGVGTPDTVVAMTTTNGDIASVLGLQTPAPAWEEKCCKWAEKCTPEDPNFWNMANCIRIPGGCGDKEGYTCIAYVGQPLRNTRCFEPPPEAIVVPQCRESTWPIDCQQYRTGACSTHYIPNLPPRPYCSCDLDSDDPEWAKGRVLCVTGSSICSQIVPASSIATTGN